MMLRVLLQYFSALLGKRPMPTLAAGKTAPTFQLATTTGESLSLQAALAKGPLLVAFFKVSCPTCQYTFPYLERLHQQLREHGVQIWGVVQDKVQDAERFAAAYTVTFPILVDDYPYKTSREYNLKCVPTLFLIAPDGRIEMSSEGFCKVDLLAIQKSLAQSLATTPSPLFLPSERVPEYKPG
jgi:peroxiredoxin